MNEIAYRKSTKREFVPKPKPKPYEILHQEVGSGKPYKEKPYMSKPKSDGDWYKNESINLSSRYLHKVITESIQKFIFEEGSFVPSNYDDDENLDDSLSDVERGYPNHWIKEMHGTDEEFNAFMKWAMTDGNDYGFGDAAGEYVNDGDPMRLHNVAMQYAIKFKMHPEKAFNMAKEAAEGIYGFANDMGSNAIDLTNMDIN